MCVCVSVHDHALIIHHISFDYVEKKFKIIRFDIQNDMIRPRQNDMTEAKIKVENIHFLF